MASLGSLTTMVFPAVLAESPLLLVATTVATTAFVAFLIAWLGHRLGPRPQEPQIPARFAGVEIPTWSNRPRPRDFFVSRSRGERIYYELHGVAPSEPHCRGLIFLNSGYSSHTMRPTYVPLLQALGDAGFAVATHDWSGHGYSEGLRCGVSVRVSREARIRSTNCS